MKNQAILIGVILLVIVGFVSLRGPKPAIELAPEPLVTFHQFDDQLADIPDALPDKINRIIDLSVALRPQITNSMITSWIVVAFLSAFVFLATRRMKLVPSGLQNLVEAFIEGFLRLVEGVAGEKNGRRFFPVVTTIFIFVLINNWFGILPFFGNIGLFREPEHSDAVVAKDVGGVALIMPQGLFFSPPEELEVNLPEDATHEQREEAFRRAAEEKHLADDKRVGVLVPFFRSVNTDVNAPAALAIISFIFVEFWGISSLGFRTYMGKFVNTAGLRRGKIGMGFIDLGVGALEALSELIRLVSFTFRLFGNTVAGEVLLLIFVFLVPFMLQQGAYALELFFGAIQAFIFAMLTLVFGVMAVAHHGPEAGEEHAHGSEATHG